MAKTQADLSIEGHINGDADGLGCARGIVTVIKIVLEGAAIVGFGFFLHWFWT